MGFAFINFGEVRKRLEVPSVDGFYLKRRKRQKVNSSEEARAHLHYKSEFKPKYLISELVAYKF